MLTQSSLSLQLETVTSTEMRLQAIGLPVMVFSLLVLSAGRLSTQREPDSTETPPQQDDSFELLERLAENSKRLAEQAMGRVLELLSDNNQEKLKHITKDLWEKATKTLKEVLEE
ncbi:uncharacterized protein LOC132833877 isoform X2 [Hemiscyllium ocellatum]|uniref:uncharacterized protein LOC132833877 isoform X2 n=1 Tax=Hemiscyllium ocellatum TaxID=170820 RepID=UPI0029666E4A|nr:uncharacterized protein LOC132833877 isoform X2 [Hemiscyllium ocellatum]